MTEEAQPEGTPRQQVNLQQIAQQFMAGLQRHFDMLAFNLAAREDVREEDYEKHAQRPRVMPVAARHQNFEQMQAYARDLLVRQVLGDCMNLTVTCMNNAHFFLALVKATGGSRQVEGEAQKKAQELQQAFVKMPLDQKFERLEQDYGVMCELEDSMTSLGFLVQALLQQNGQLKDEQLDTSGELVLELKAAGSADVVGAEAAQAKLVDQRKVFRKGEPIVFADTELQLALVTVASFANALFKNVADYARSQQGGA